MKERDTGSSEGKSKWNPRELAGVVGVAAIGLALTTTDIAAIGGLMVFGSVLYTVGKEVL